MSDTQEQPNPEIAITAAQLMVAFAGLFLLNLLLRVFYLRYDFVNGDEGVRALTAVRMLEGARLYADVVTDKPPGASLFYAAVFTVFGHSMKAVHLAAIVWNFATSVIVYRIGARFYNKRIGLWAALLFVYFSTNYFTQDMMAANTELLMALPYAVAFYFFMIGAGAYEEHSVVSARAALIAAGVLTGVATLFKQIGVLNLVFFSFYEMLALWIDRGRGNDTFVSRVRRVVGRLSLVGVGFALVLVALIVWLESMGALGDFWRNGIVLNMFYIDSAPLGLWARFAVGRGLGYVFFNAVLWVLAGWAALRSFKEVKRDRSGVLKEATPARFDVSVTLWCVVSLVAVIMSGRFFGHYFIPALPALSLLGARGVQLFGAAVRDPTQRRRAQGGLAVLSVLFLVGLLRCHHRTAVLAYETVTGTRTRWSRDWGMTTREEEAAIVSRFVRERVPAGEPLYIWGYAHDVFWRTGCRPASRYLTPYYLDGRFADAEATVSPSGEEFRREAAANLMEDLRRAKPRLILDVEGSFKTLPHPELVGFVESNYVDEGSAGPDASRPFRVLRLRSDDERNEGVERK